MATLDEYIDQLLADDSPLLDVDPDEPATLDEYIDQLLADDSPLQGVAQNILDEPILDAVKKRLLKPLAPRKYRPSPPPRKAKDRKKKAVEIEFDPISRQKSLRSVKEYQDEILDLFAEKDAGELALRPTPWVIGRFLRGWQMEGRGADPRAFLEEAKPHLNEKLVEELAALNGVKFQLALKVSLRKDKPDGSEEYTSPVLRHKQEAVLQEGEIKESLNRAFSNIQELLEKWTQRGSGWAVDRVEMLWLDIARYQPLRGECHISLPKEVKSKHAVVN